MVLHYVLIAEMAAGDSEGQDTMDEFKKCSCGSKWKSREDFMADPNIRMLGLQKSYSPALADLYLFNHSLGINGLFNISVTPCRQQSIKLKRL